MDQAQKQNIEKHMLHIRHVLQDSDYEKNLRHGPNNIAYKYKHTHVRVRGRETIQRQIKEMRPNSRW